MQLDIGSVFKYHNHIVKVVKKSADNIITEMYFVDYKTGNPQFNIPTDKIATINIEEIASKTQLKEILKDITEKPAQNTIAFFSENDQPISKFNLALAAEGIKILVDEKINNKDSFSPNKASKLKELMNLVAKEIAIAFDKDLLDAGKMLKKSVDARTAAI